MALNVTPFVGTDNFNMETFNNMITQITLRRRYLWKPMEKIST